MKKGTTGKQQGKPYTDEQRLTIIESLRPYLEAGLSRNRACDAIGFDATTLSVWVKENVALSMKLKGWENTLNILAMANIASALEKEGETEGVQKETSKWWLERRMKNEFSTRTEASGPDGEPLFAGITTEEKTALLLLLNDKGSTS